MKELLLKYGFIFIKSCSCTGIYKETYTKGTYTIEVMSKVQSPYFNLKQNHQIIYSRKPLNEIETAIQEKVNG